MPGNVLKGCSMFMYYSVCLFSHGWSHQYYISFFPFFWQYYQHTLAYKKNQKRDSVFSSITDMLDFTQQGCIFTARRNSV